MRERQILTLLSRRLALASLARPSLWQASSVEALDLPPSLTLPLPLRVLLTQSSALDSPTDADLHPTCCADTLATAENLE